MYLKEIGVISAILPFTSRAGDLKLQKGKIKYGKIYNEKSFFEDLAVTSTCIKDADYVNSEYSLLVTKGAKRLGFSKIDGLTVENWLVV